MSSSVVNKNLFNLRDIHVDVENIYEEIKTNKSQFIYRNFFWFLFIPSVFTFLTHMYMRGFSYSTFFLILIIFYYFYHTLQIKRAKKEYLETPRQLKVEPENIDFLKTRIKYVQEGVNLILFRAKKIREFYIIFFPLFSITLINLINGGADIRVLLSSIIVSILIGGLFWYYYFRIDIGELEDDICDLKRLRERMNESSL